MLRHKAQNVLKKQNRMNGVRVWLEALPLAGRQALPQWCCKGAARHGRAEERKREGEGRESLSELRE